MVSNNVYSRLFRTFASNFHTFNPLDSGLVAQGDISNHHILRNTSCSYRIEVKHDSFQQADIWSTELIIKVLRFVADFIMFGE